MSTDFPLGKVTDYPHKYAPEMLHPMPRALAREPIGLAGKLPFWGVDIWHAWELGWLGPSGKPEVATAQIRVPAETPRLVESKSLKLYLGSFAMTRFDSPLDVAELISKDLRQAVGGAVELSITRVSASEGYRATRLPGACIDALDTSCDVWDVDAALLSAEANTVVREDLYSHLLRSVCPVTGQPDIGSLSISYSGPRIDRRSLLRYIVSFRQHGDFHEACVERMFVDILDRCAPMQLTVVAYYQRRGGIDINPFRSNFESPPPAVRLWRQ